MKLSSYRAERLSAVTARPGMSLRRVMALMNEAGLRLAPIADDDGALLGVAADGDIRRYLARGGDLDQPIMAAANHNPKVLDHPMPAASLRSWMLARNIETVPELLNGRLIALHAIWVVDTASDMTAVIMAGGLGSRLSPLTDNCPKPLLKIGDLPILTHIMNHLQAEGVRRFVLPVNYLSGMIMDYYGDGSDTGIQIDYVQETKRMGTGGALSLIDPALLSDPFIVMNGDLLTDLDLGALVGRHRSMEWDGTMVVREHHYTIPYGVVRANGEYEFLSADEKPTYNYLINAGMYLLSQRMLDLVPQDTFYDLPTMFQDMQRCNMKGGVHTHGGRWIDIGSIADFQRAKDIIERRQE